MPTVQYRPTSPGRRFQTGSDFAELTKARPEGSLTAPLGKSGDSLPLSVIPLGTMGHNGELRAGRGGPLGRRAGAAIQLMAKEGDYALVKLPSGELRRVRLACRATVGQVGNLEHENISYGKAGRIRWLGRRPKVRGMAMNPVDHPHGAGEGRSKGNHPQP